MKHAVFWSGFEAGGAALCSIVSAFVVARLIGPGEFGIGAAAIAVHVLLWVAVNSLFADAIVQRDRIDEAALSSALWASIATGVAAATIQVGSGWMLARAFHDSRFAAMGLLLAVPLPAVGLGGALQGKLTRERRYRALALRTLIGQSAGMTVGVALAFRHAGAWAPVAQQATVSLVAPLVLAAAAPWRPRAVFAWAEVRDLLRVGLPLTGSTLVQIGRYRVFALLIGYTAGAHALGLIHVAFRLADTVREIAFTALWRLFLPVLSEHQRDRAALLARVDRLGFLASLATMPLCGGMILTLAPAAQLILGRAWGEAGIAAIPLACLTGLMALMFPSGVALIAAGEARLTLYANLMGLAATVAFVLLARPASPWSAVMVWCGAQAFVSPYSLWVNSRALGVGPFRPLRAGLPALLAVGAGVALALVLAPDSGGAAETAILRCLTFGAVLAICGAGWIGLSLLSSCALSSAARAQAGSRPRAERAADDVGHDSRLPVPRAGPEAVDEAA